MTEFSLQKLMYNHLVELGIPCDFELKLGGYSSSYYGRYDTKNEVITLYHLTDDMSLMEIDELLSILRHEAIHHFQWKHDTQFKRIKGIMHNLEFYRLEKFYAYKYELRKRERLCLAN